MKRAIDSFVQLLAEFTEAQSVVLYREEGGVFSPLSYFSLAKDLVLDPFYEDDDNIVAEVVRKWEPLITNDRALFEDMGLPYYETTVPKVFMAIPFKLGGSRAVLCLDSLSLGAFPDRHQRIVRQSLELFRAIDALAARVAMSSVPEAKLRFLLYALKLFTTLPLEDAFDEWCRFLGVEFGGFFVWRDGEPRLELLYKGDDFPLEDPKPHIPARSAVRIAVDKEDVYCFCEDRARIFDGYEAYAVLVPVRLDGLKGLLVLTSQDSQHFNQQVTDIFEAAARVVSVVWAKQRDRGTDNRTLVEPLEVENKLRILVARAQKEGACVGVILFIVRSIDKEYAKKGFWKVEERMKKLAVRCSALNPPPEFVSRLSDNVIMLAGVFGSAKDAQDYRVSFNTATADAVDFKECSSDLLLYPVDADSVNELLSLISDKVVKSRKRGIF